MLKKEIGLKAATSLFIATDTVQSVKLWLYYIGDKWFTWWCKKQNL